MAIISSLVSSGELESLFGAVPDAVITSDHAGNVEFLNQAAERLTGFALPTAVGRPTAEVLPLTSDRGTPVESPAAACLRSGDALGPFEARLGSQGRRRVLDILAAPTRDSDGSIAGVLLIARDITGAHQIARKLSHQATHDALTGLVNRSEFERRLAQVLGSAANHGATHAVGFLDLDGFKQINDVCGHHAGDELLQELSELMRRGMRARDTLARLGGDEFGILLEHCSPKEAVRIAQKIRKVVGEHRFSCGGMTYQVGTSIGIVPVRGSGLSLTEVLREADSACYQAKRSGGNRVQLAGGHHAPVPRAQRVRPSRVLASEQSYSGEGLKFELGPADKILRDSGAQDTRPAPV
jgi:diguanylate cyclase (GGDEF)-like protein/PAS domain S-box-containing protein